MLIICPLKKLKKLPEDEKPVIIVIENYPEFKQRLTRKLLEIGLHKDEIIEAEVHYCDFNKYGEFGYWDFCQNSPMELAIKNIRFQNQSEGRFIINTDNQHILQLLSGPIEIGPLDDICTVCDRYLHDGMDIVAKVNIEQANK